jgi:hypothetical protein
MAFTTNDGQNAGPSELVITSSVGSGLMQILMDDSVVTGSDLSYELAKLIYLYHPLGQKMAESPINMAQSQSRKVAVQDAPDEVTSEFLREWEKINANGHIHNVMRLARIYGIASLIIGCDQVKADQPLDMEKIWQQDLWFSELDPLNTAGSMVLSQVPTSPDFNKPVSIRVNGEVFHRSRYQVVLNESPIYLAYTTSAFGFVGRSVYQRALFPLKSFIRSMIADDMIATKLGLLIAKQKAPGSILDRAMQLIAGVKRALLRQAQTNQVLSIGIEEEIETLNMMNVDGAGTYSRTNILKNIATAADMPAKLLENETLVAGFGEGTEDAKNIARYIDLMRMKMQPLYAFFDNIVQYRVWNPQFYERIQSQYPDTYGDMEYREAFLQWRNSFQAGWPSLLIEPESEQIKVEQTKLDGIIEFMEVALPLVDPENLGRIMNWAADNINENKMMFPHGLELDYEALSDHAEDKADQEAEALKNGMMPPGGGGAQDNGSGAKQPAKQPPKANVRRLERRG